MFRSLMITRTLVHKSEKHRLSTCINCRASGNRMYLVVSYFRNLTNRKPNFTKIAFTQLCGSTVLIMLSSKNVFYRHLYTFELAVVESTQRFFLETIVHRTLRKAVRPLKVRVETKVLIFDYQHDVF